MTIRTRQPGENTASNGYANRHFDKNGNGKPMELEHSPIPSATQEQIASLTHLLYECTRENLVGIYAHGSLAMGCFNPQVSDIDLLVITQQPLNQGARRQILGGLLELSGAPHPVEISVVYYAQIDPWRHPAPFDLHFSEAWRTATNAVLANVANAARPGGEDSDLAGHFTVLKRRGLCLAGAPIADLRMAVPWEDYLASLRSDFEWAVTGDEVSPVYMVLNACRCWAAVADGVVLSKAEGGVWAAGRVPARFRSLIARSCAVYRGKPAEATIDAAEARAFHGWIGKRLGW